MFGRGDDMSGLEYLIRVAGQVDPEILEELPDIRVASQSVETVLRGTLPDQAALVGLINRLQGLGIELHGVRQLEPE